MVTREAIVAAAREALNTPFHHQGRKVGNGLDCIGLPVHVATRVGVAYVDGLPYSTLPKGAELLAGLARSLEPIPICDGLPGDVLVFWIRRRVAPYVLDPEIEDEPRHIAIKTAPDRMIHTYSRKGPRGDLGKVQEHAITDFWEKRVHSAWRFPGLAT